MTRRSIAVLIGGFLACAACGQDPAKEIQEARADAVATLACPFEQITVVDLGAVGKGSDDVRATGCMGVAWYGCDTNGSSCSGTFLVTRVTGAVTVDGVAFVPAGPDVCIPGDRNGFFGVDLHDANGEVLRLVEDPTDGSGTVVHVSADGSRSPPLEGCADLRFKQTGDRISGTAHIACSAGAAVIVGDLGLQTCAHDPWQDPT